MALPLWTQVVEFGKDCMGDVVPAVPFITTSALESVLERVLASGGEVLIFPDDTIQAYQRSEYDFAFGYGYTYRKVFSR